MKKKTSFIIHLDYQTLLEDLSLEDKGMILEAMFCYVKNEPLPKLKPLSKMAFSFIKRQMDYDNEKWVKTCEKRAEAGSRGGLAKASKSSKSKQNKQSLANLADNDNVNDNENDNVKDNVKDKELAIKVLDHLNKTTSSAYRPVGNNLDLIVARLRDMRDNPVGIDKYPDIPLEEWAYNVINIKNAKWCKDEKMRDFLRPTTLFRKTNFENYLSEVLTVFGRGR
jgi:uncharacterized phage protein (TIGR02220 family)